jgi:hypothetical protein
MGEFHGKSIDFSLVGNSRPAVQKIELFYHGFFHKRATLAESCPPDCRPEPLPLRQPKGNPTRKRGDSSRFSHGTLAGPDGYYVVCVTIWLDRRGTAARGLAQFAQSSEQIVPDPLKIAETR